MHLFLIWYMMTFLGDKAKYFRSAKYYVFKSDDIGINMWAIVLLHKFSIALDLNNIVANFYVSRLSVWW